MSWSRKISLSERSTRPQRASTWSAGEPVAVGLQAHACQEPKTVADLA